MNAESLITQSSEALEFLADARKNATSLLLYPEERFVEFDDVCLGGTGTDLQGERHTLADIQRVVERIDEGPFWITVHHNPLIHPLGRVLTAKVFYAEGTGIHFVAALIGRYDPNTFRSLQDQLNPMPEPNLIGDSELDQAEKPYLSFNIFEIPFSLVEKLIDCAPPLVDNKVAQERRKSAETVIAILRLVLPAGLLFGMAKKAGEKVTELATEQLFTWIRDTVVKKLSEFRRESQQETLLVLESTVAGCLIEFVISTRDEYVRIDAARLVDEAFRSSIAIVQHFAEHSPSRLVFAYEEDRKEWLPLYLVTSRGIFTDRPYLEVVRARGLSLASRGVDNCMEIGDSAAGETAST